MKILITGASGYMGRHIVNNLLELGHEIIAVDKKEGESRHNLIYDQFDIFNQNQNIFMKYTDVDALLYLAWQDNFNHNSDGHMNNLHLHYSFIKKAIEAGIKNITIMGSMHEIGYYEGCVDENTPCFPLSLYGIAKNAFRQSVLLLANEKVKIKWLRAYYIMGDDANNNSIFTKIIQWEKEKKEYFPFTSGKNKFDFIDINELSLQITETVLQNEIDGIINVCSGKPVALKDKVEEFLDKNNFKIRPIYGQFPERKYESPAIWGDNTKISKIMEGKKK